LDILEDRCLLSYTINEFPLPSANAGPDWCEAGPDGNVWFVEDYAKSFARVTPAGQITEIPIPSPLNAENWTFFFGPDGNIWIGGHNDIAEMTPQGVLLHDYTIPSALSAPESFSVLTITMGSDGNIWYTEGYVNDLIGRLTPDGEITEFPIPGDAFGFTGAEQIIPGPGGKLWFASTETNGIGSIDPTATDPGSTMQIFNVPVSNPGVGAGGEGVRGLTFDSQGNLWMAEQNTSQPRWFEFNTSTDQATVVLNPTPGTHQYGMTLASDGSLWFTDNANNAVGQIILTTNGIASVTEYPLPIPQTNPSVITTGPGDTVWFNSLDSNTVGEVIVRPDTTTALTSSANPSLFGQQLTFTATVTPAAGTGTPSGTVQFQIDSANVGAPVPLTAGSASFSTATVPVGSHTITALYSGDANFLASSGTLVQSVQYNFSGFLPPLGQGLTFALGRTIPIKFQLTDFNRNFITSLSAITALQVVYPDGSLHALAGLRYDPTANQFIANWQSKGLAAGNYTLGLVLADGTTHTISLSLSKSGGSAGLTTSGAGGTGSAPGGLLGGNIELYVDNTSGNLTANQLARIQDAVSGADAVTEAYGVVVEEVGDPTQADVTLSMAATSAVGGYADGVLGCTTDAGQITLIAGWSFYAGSDTTLIPADQYDFETVVLHELGHALGLGYSADITSVMYATLDPGAAKRTLVTADLNVPDIDNGACGLHAAVLGKGDIQDSPALVLPAEYRFGAFPSAAGPVPLAASAQGRAATGARVFAQVDSFWRREGSRNESVAAAHHGLNRPAQDQVFAAEDDPFAWF
jgi:virginiamycin B lyase